MSFPRLYHALRLTVFVFFIAAIILLLFLAGFSTSAIQGDFREHTFFLRDSFLINILICAVLFFLSFAGDKILLKIKKRLCTKVNIGNVGIIAFFLLSAAWVLLTQPELISDQAYIQESAAQLSYGDLTPLLEGGYCVRHQHQIGAVFFSILFQSIFGRNNLICYQLINAALCALCYKELIQIAKHTVFKDSMELELPVLGMVFYPLLLYSTFVYPMIPSFYLSLVSFRQISSYLEDKRVKALIKGALAMAGAIVLKPNALIFLIALILVSLFGGYGKRSLTAAALLLIFSAGSVLLPKVAAEQIYHVKIQDGISPWSYIAMGMQEGERAPGWYNEYVNTNYAGSGYDEKTQKENALDQIGTQIKRFKNSPKEAIRFYLQKTASQWNNPTFEAFWIHEVRSKRITMATWVNRLTRVTGAQILAIPLNYLQFFILIGSVLFGILVLPSANPVELLFPLTFVGGLVFHFIWEAKCQYTLIYFTLLLPCSIMGMKAFFQIIHASNYQKKIKKEALVIAALFLLLNMVLVLPNKNFVSGDDEQFKQYLEEYRKGSS